MTTVDSFAWPLLFTYKGPVIGNGFLSHVELCGRILAVPETEGVWLDGVNPGAFAVGATTLDEANQILRDALTKVFLDFAESTKSFASFKTTVEEFYHKTDDETLTRWEVALKALEAGQLFVPTGLPRKPKEWVCSVAVTEKALDQLTPNDNAPVDNAPQLAAAA